MTTAKRNTARSFRLLTYNHAAFGGAALCAFAAAVLSFLNPVSVDAQVKPTYSLFNATVDLYLQQTCSGSTGGAAFSGMIGALNRAANGGQSTLYYTFDSSGMKTGYESASAVNTLNVAATNTGFTPNGLPDGAVHFRFVTVSAECGGESLYVWPGSAQSVLDPDTSMYAYPFSEAVEEPLR